MIVSHAWLSREESGVNGFDVQAIGWVLTRDICCEVARTCLGLKPPLARATLEELGKRWRKVAAAVADDRMAMSYGARIVWARGLPLSNKSEEAMQEFIKRLIAFRPDRYSTRALRARCVDGCIQTAAGFLGCLILGHYASPENPTLGQAALVLLLMGCWSLTTTFQLRRIYNVIRRLGGEQIPSVN